jgi:fused signal recognition particle receptor
MFKLLREKLSSVVSSISKNVTETIPKKIVERRVTEKDLKDVLDDLEMSLIESDVALEVSDKIRQDLIRDLVGKEIKRGKVKDEVTKAVRKSLVGIFDAQTIDLKRELKKRPYLMVFLGFNGAGKTTTIAKIANLLKKQGYTSVFAAGDSFRAASIEQLEVHGKKLGIKTIKHDYGADPAAIVFDAVKHAESNDVDVVLADTAGRAHTNRNLMDQLEKVCRVNKPDLKILVVDSITGNDVVEQARMFDKAAGIDALIFTKADVNPKGGAILSVSYLLKKPVMFIGTGQEYKDLKEFDKEWFVDQILK